MNYCARMVFSAFSKRICLKLFYFHSFHNKAHVNSTFSLHRCGQCGRRCHVRLRTGCEDSVNIRCSAALQMRRQTTEEASSNIRHTVCALILYKLGRVWLEWKSYCRTSSNNVHPGLTTITLRLIRLREPCFASQPCLCYDQTCVSLCKKLMLWENTFAVLRSQSTSLRAHERL